VNGQIVSTPWKKKLPVLFLHRTFLNHWFSFRLRNYPEQYFWKIIMISPAPSSNLIDGSTDLEWQLQGNVQDGIILFLDNWLLSLRYKENRSTNMLCYLKRNSKLKPLMRILVQTCSVALIFTLNALGTNGLQLNRTRSMSLSDLELQYDQASAVLPIVQRKYSNSALAFWFPLVITNYLTPWSQFLLE
jgi:hypothetical protein